MMMCHYISRPLYQIFTQAIDAIDVTSVTLSCLRHSVRMSLGVCPGASPKILNACRMLQISIAWCQNDAEIRGFPPMYMNGGG